MEQPQAPTPPSEKKLWFRAKTHGYGWYPATWQGWGVIVMYVLAVVFAAWDILRGAEVGVVAVKRFVITIFILSLFLLYVCYNHGEKLMWRWGKKEESEHGDDRSG